MEWYQAGAMMIGMVIALMALGVPVAIAFFAANIVGVTQFMGGTAGLYQLADNATSFVTTFTLVPVPLFLLMGELFFHTGLAVRVFDALDKLLGRIPGRLAYLTVAGGTAFSTLTGATMANTAMLGSLLVPEMTRRGYKRYMSMGPILGTGGLAMLIPPSSLAVLLAAIALIDVAALLIAGLIPGLILAVLYAVMIALQLWLDPAAAPGYHVEPTPWTTKLLLVVTNILPMGLILFCVVGLIVLGLATPSESAAFGVLGVVVLAAAFGGLGWEAVRRSLFGTIRVAGMALLILMASSTFSQVLAVSGASGGFIGWATGLALSPYALLLLMFGVILVLGMFMDSLSIMLLTMPIFMPLATAIGFDQIWFGVVVLLALEMSLTTPPFGILLFIMLGVAPKGTTLFEVARAAAPFLICDAILLGLLVAWPDIALYLPSLMVR